MVLLLGLFELGLVLCLIRPTEKKQVAFLIISGVVLATISGIRYAVGVDYNAYARMYEDIRVLPLKDLFTAQHEPLFVLLEMLTSVLFKNYQYLFVVTSVAMIAVYWFYIYKYSPIPLVSVMLFLLLGDYYCSMNFVRQTLAAGISVYAFTYLVQRRPIGYMVVILIAAGFHKSALLMIPFYFILQIPLTKKLLALFTSGVLFVYLTVDFWLALGAEHWFPQYQIGSSKDLQFGSPIPLVLLPIALFLLFLWFEWVMAPKNIYFTYFTRYLFFSAVCFFLSLKYTILDRFSMYFSPVILIAFPMLIQELIRARQHIKVDPRRESSTTRRARQTGEQLCVLVLLACFVYHFYFLKLDGHGVLHYQTIFQQPFYKEYVQSLQEDDVIEEPIEMSEPEDLLQPEDL